MPIIDKIADWLILIILSGASVRVGYCCLRMISGNEQDQGMYKTRAKHALTMAVVALSIYVIRDIVLFYFK